MNKNKIKTVNENGFYFVIRFISNNKVTIEYSRKTLWEVIDSIDVRIDAWKIMIYENHKWNTYEIVTTII